MCEMNWGIPLKFEEIKKHQNARGNTVVDDNFNVMGIEKFNDLKLKNMSITSDNKKELVDNFMEIQCALDMQIFNCKNDPDYPDKIDLIELNRVRGCLDEIDFILTMNKANKL